MARIRKQILACAALLMTAAPQVAAAADTPASWLKKPTQEDLLGLWPTEAMHKGIGGKATIRCIVTVQGTLRDCAIAAESPAGAGFGAAAQALSHQLLMKPATHDGKPVESQVRIPIEFADPGVQTGSNIRGDSMSQGLAVRYYSKMTWVEAPSFSDVVAAYPAKARAESKGGVATLDCAFVKGGKLGNCEVLREEPRGYGFGSAAHKLSTKFAAPDDPASVKALSGARMQLLFAFDPASLTGAPVIGKPQWMALPTGEDLAAALPAKASAARVLNARVVVRCVVAPNGGLTGCVVETEDPVGYDYGPAALGLASKFRLSVWTDEGLPTVGGAVRVPIRFAFTDPTPAPAKP